MTTKDVAALAELLRSHNRSADGRTEFTPDHILVLADFCETHYPNFNRERWIDFIEREGAQGEDWIFVEPDSAKMPGCSKPADSD